MQVQRFASGTVWEEQVGYSRIVRAGNLLWSAGTVAANEDGEIQGADAYEQCCFIFEKLGRALAEAGSSLEHVVKVSAFITDIEHADGFMRAHKQYVGAAMPACTCVVVAALFGSALAEIELFAIVP